jgi:flavin-dependent dehydrogenase
MIHGLEARATSPCRSRAAIQVRGDAVLVDRDRLDAYLAARAEEAGAHLFRTRARRVRRSASGWTVETEGPTFAAPILVGADGCRSIVRRAVAGPWRPSDVVLAVGVTAEWPDLAPGVCRPGMVRALFPAARRGRQDAARHGYAYVFGRSDGAVLGYWRRGIGGREVLAGLRGLCERWLCGSGPSPAEADCGPRRRALPHPRGRMMPCLASGGAAMRPTGGADWMLVGDAAGHVNPVTGEGIRFALRGGRLAAEAILDGRPRSYPDRWEADFGGLLRWGARLVEFCEWTTVLRRLIGRAARSDRGARALADLAFARRDYAGLYFKGAAAYAMDALIG